MLHRLLCALALLGCLATPAWACTPPALGSDGSLRTLVLDGLMADAEAARALQEAGLPEAARRLMTASSERAEARLVLLMGPEDPALEAVLALGTSRDVLARVIAAAMLADAIPPAEPATTLARALALFGWASEAWAALAGCTEAAAPVLDARVRAAMVWGENLAREALLPLATAQPAAVAAASDAITALTLLVPPPGEPGGADLAGQVAVRLGQVRTAVAVLLR